MSDEIEVGLKFIRIEGGLKALYDAVNKDWVDEIMKLGFAEGASKVILEGLKTAYFQGATNQRQSDSVNEAISAMHRYFNGNNVQ